MSAVGETARGAQERDIDETIRHLASFPRPSASEGERRAAEWIAQRLRTFGWDARIEHERAHGTYWWPLGLLCGLAALGGALGRRAGLLIGAAASAGAIDDVSGGRLWFRRRLPSRPTYNVVAEAGDPDAAHTVLLMAHHDAAHSGIVFHPALGPGMAQRFPRLLARTNSTFPAMWLVVGGPILVTLGALLGSRRLRRAGLVLSSGSAAAMADIGTRDVVAGANDNLSGVAALLSVAQSLAGRAPPGVRVILLSTGSEESFMEGMQAFARRHFPGLPVDRTTVICLDTVGSLELIALEGEGMLWMNDYTASVKEMLSEHAKSEGIHLRRGLRFRFATDALIALRAGYPTAMLGSVNEFRLPANYHWPTDVPDNVHVDTVASAANLCEALIRGRATRD
jgi:Peptidase family M28